ncbi:cyclic nucleotide-binding domain-containing protein [Clostridium sp. SHJSY1]|uniref:cyclic nucleotide-binding domain-containing protein n=1 Tax=Clostridium sp. SHJSY1 TaxID=2942483 RepID=UPI002875A199|nr:cyclic nucleotide-binding domain-containing protein [Clostridium sp. SHJSY1]MDS0524621.1 cyclic nucleotide-binding domain-containing protein [Clostridium sp. SHJSY1]
MKKIENNKIKEMYIKKYKLNEVFTNDMRGFMELLCFDRNEFLSKQNEKVDYLYFIVKGKLKVFKTLKNGKNILLSFNYPLMMLGDLELMNSEGADANIQVIEDAYCIALHVDKVQEILLNDIKYLRYACNSISKKLKDTSKNSAINLLYPLENRLASYMLAMKSHVNGKLVFEENLTEIAELLGTSYRHLLRTLEAFIKKGALEKTNRSYEIIDENLLIILADDLYK